MKLQARALEQIAAAFALGTLSPRATRRFEAMLAHDIAARRAWQQWEQRLSDLAPDLPSVRPPDSSWPAIERRLRGKPSTRSMHQSRWLIAAAVVVGIAFYLVWRKVRP